MSCHHHFVEAGNSTGFPITVKREHDEKIWQMTNFSREKVFYYNYCFFSSSSVHRREMFGHGKLFFWQIFSLQNHFYGLETTFCNNSRYTDIRRLVLMLESMLVTVFYWGSIHSCGSWCRGSLIQMLGRWKTCHMFMC